MRIKQTFREETPKMWGWGKNYILITLSEAWMKPHLKVSTSGSQIRKFSLLLKSVSVGFSATGNIES